ncbi:DUF1214 domain-containing protein [Microbulbifer sp. 2304DJ12-6]|uniref:DUF1214 domain-containing protein n=1 Tax=Microbulbifer sp. 2304DJ12-6 TaxID=3233340 RepID=UPI0039B06758
MGNEYPYHGSLWQFAISSWMDLKKGNDGSVVIYIQSQSPGKDKEANWLPAPKGEFNVLMRLYAPKPAVLFDRWSPPPIVKSSTYK